MRKIYSIVLMACAMLVSASVFAVDVTTRQQIQDAINNTPVGGTVDIRLMNNIDVDATIFIYAKYAEAGRTVNLDLNGYNMGVAGPTMIKLLKGTLNITGTGMLEKTGKTEADLIVVGGSYKETDANWSNLTIGKDVKLNAHAGASGGKETSNAISVLEIYSLTQSTYSLVGGAAITDPMDAAQLAATGVNFNTVPNAYKMNGEAMLDYTSGWYRYNTTAVASGTYAGKYKTNTSSVLGYAYGVNIEILGKVHGSKYGIKINGNIRTSGANVPYVHIASSAEVSSAPQTGNSVAVYSSGVGRFEIEGYVHGASGVYVKAGSVELNDAVVKSDFTGGHNMPKGTNSGVSAGGSAITIESNKSYGGNHEVVIKGDTKVEGGSGFAIEESITTSSASNVSEVKIEGGTFVAGGEGAIVITDKTAAEAKVEIVGGNVENLILIENDGNYTAAEVSDFVPAAEADHYKTTAVTDEAGKTTIVVTYFEDTADKPVEATSVIAATDETGVEWISTADTEETLIDSKTLTYLEAISTANKQTLNVGDADHNVTLKVGRIVLGPKAKIVVAAGSRLIVDGEQGIVANTTDNIVLEANSDKYAQFLFDPTVSSNRHPKATIEWISDSYRKSSTDRLNQPFGIPTANKVDNIYTDRTDHRVAFFEYNYDESVDDWVNIGYLNPENASQAVLDKTKLNKPFNYYQILCTSETAGTKVTMQGELVGNVNNKVDYLAHYYMGFANSYTADIDLATILPTVPGANEAVYIYMKEYGEWHWVASTIEDMYTSKIAPMQAFVILNRGAASSSEINYQNFVWNPVMNPTNAAPARKNYDNKLRVRVMGQNATDLVTLMEADRFTTGFDKGEAEKYMNNGLNIYVTDETSMAIFGSDDINNTYLGFNCKKSGTYTLNFEQLAGEGLALVDLENNAVVNIDNNATYEFTAEENEQNDYRFQIVKRQNVVTDVETVEAAAKASGIYTLTGMYLGNMSIWNTLPAGIYVVNGEKMVK